MKRKRRLVLPSASRLVAALLAALLAMGLPYGVMNRAAPQAIAQSTISREYTIKAAYLYNFARYVRWPAGTFRKEQDPLVIGVLGTDPLGNALDRIARTKKIDGRRIVIRRFDSLDKYSPCHILFVPRSVEPKRQIEAIGRLRKSPVLLVGETPGFAERGGTINFFIRQNKIRFEINQQAAKRGGLKVSAKLLNLAKLVKEDPNDKRAAASSGQRAVAGAR